MSECIPWDELAESYYQGFAADSGRPLKDARRMIGAVMIKHKLCLSDVETVQKIQENPYLQFFVGLPGYQSTEPFAASLFVEIRKRMGEAVFEGFHRAIIEAHEGKKPGKPAPQTPSASADCSAAVAAFETEHVAVTTSVSPVETQEPAQPEAAAMTPRGQLILDATVVEQASVSPPI